MTPLVIDGAMSAKASYTCAGKPARVDGVPVWGSSNPAVLTVTPAEDGMTASIVAVGAGDAQVTMTAQAGGTALTAPPLDVHVDLPHADAAAIVV